MLKFILSQSTNPFKGQTEHDLKIYIYIYIYDFVPTCPSYNYLHNYPNCSPKVKVTNKRGVPGYEQARCAWLRTSEVCLVTNKRGVPGYDGCGPTMLGGSPLILK